MPRGPNNTKKNVNVWMEPEWIQRIDALAVRCELSRARLLENIIKMNVEELEVVGKLGFFSAVRFSRVLGDLREGIRSWAEQLKMEGLSAFGASGRDE